MPLGEAVDIGVRLLVAGALGAVLGVERELRGHAAGVRTFSLVALGSALMTAVGELAFEGAGADPTRIASQVVTGMGFIGAGVIIKHRANVKGLTTAATLWVACAVGVASGAGAAFAAALGVGLALAFVFVLNAVKPLLNLSARWVLEVDYETGHGTMGPVLRAVQELRGEVDDVVVEDEHDGAQGPVRHLAIRIITREEGALDRLVKSIQERPEVYDVRLVEE